MKMTGRIFELYFYAESNPLAEGPSRVEELLELIRRDAAGLVPDRAAVGKKNAEFSNAAVQRLLAGKKADQMVVLRLNRQADPEVSYSLSFMGGGISPGFWLWMMLPFSYFEDAMESTQRSVAFVNFIRSLAMELPTIYAFGHLQDDASLGKDPTREDPFAPKQVYEMYWLNVYGDRMAKKLGVDRVGSTPGCAIDELPGGAMLLLTRPTPTDCLSEEARLAQAQALVHLCKGMELESVLSELRERSKTLSPAERDWDSDIEDLLDLLMEYVPYEKRRQRVLELNQYRPPDVAEWRSVDESASADVADVGNAIRKISGEYAENLAMLLHDKVPEVMSAKPDSLPKIDCYFWRHNYPEKYSRELLQTKLVPAIGAYLGMLLVRNLGGEWVPRRRLAETQVIVGDRAWLPFNRADLYMRSRQSILDYSLTKFYRVAERSVSSSDAGKPSGL